MAKLFAHALTKTFNFDKFFFWLALLFFRCRVIIMMVLMGIKWVYRKKSWREMCAI